MNTNLDFSDKEFELYKLLQEIKRGDAEAFSRFYDLTIELVYGFCIRVLSNNKGAEGAAEQVYAYLWENASNINPEIGSFISWFLDITRSHAIAKLKDLKPDQNLKSDSENIYNLNRFPEQTEKKHRINKAVLKLNHLERTVLELSYYRGMSQSQIAQRINIPVSSVKNSLRLAVLNIRSEISNAEEHTAVAR